jgi:hypothetical protein
MCLGRLLSADKQGQGRSDHARGQVTTNSRFPASLGGIHVPQHISSIFSCLFISDLCCALSIRQNAFEFCFIILTASDDGWFSVTVRQS